MEYSILKPMVLSGRYFSKKELRQVQKTVDIFPSLSLSELALTICEHFSWVTPNGTYKINSCLKALEKLESEKLIQRPQKRLQKKPKAKAIVYTNRALRGSDVEYTLDDIGQIEVRVVKDKEEVSLWNE